MSWRGRRTGRQPVSRRPTGRRRGRCPESSAAFGPMRSTICPSGTLKVTPVTALTPPYRTLTSTTVNSGAIGNERSTTWPNPHFLTGEVGGKSIERCRASRRHRHARHRLSGRRHQLAAVSVRGPSGSLVAALGATRTTQRWSPPSSAPRRTPSVDHPRSLRSAQV